MRAMQRLSSVAAAHSFVGVLLSAEGHQARSVRTMRSEVSALPSVAVSAPEHVSGPYV
ncbi:hypothetical protein APY04_0223 [Hyphomicrobium sulfonivorans]|uniref:Uncharacterized protein n=1 Tax=Hyphomicrobium sulfonivorans TaxID=121290 RepID=A0A120CY40_HYPSL|nr:hypothetical protein APY04_0223 [Hyphomicrobium sulfonivorans]